MNEIRKTRRVVGPSRLIPVRHGDSGRNHKSCLMRMLSTYFRYHSGRTYPLVWLPTKIGCRRFANIKLGSETWTRFVSAASVTGEPVVGRNRRPTATRCRRSHGEKNTRVLLPRKKPASRTYVSIPTDTYHTRTLLTPRAVRIVAFYPEPGRSLRGRFFPRPRKLSTRRKRGPESFAPANQIAVSVDTPASAIRKTPRFWMRSASTSRKHGENALTRRTHGRGRVKPKKTTGFYGVFVSFAKRIARRPRDVRPNVLLPFYGRQ